MKTFKSKNMAKSIYIFAFLAVLIVLTIDPAFARAGGGSGGGAGLLTIILLPFLIIYSLIISGLVRRKNKEAKELAAKIEQYDPSWNMEKVNKIVEDTFYRVQDAWMQRNQDLAREYMSDSLYKQHKIQTDMMLKEHKENILLNIKLDNIKIVEIVDLKEDSRDFFWAYINGSMIDYIADDRSGAFISGDKSKTSFQELWKFVRDPRGKWVLDRIDQHILGDLKKFKSLTEGYDVELDGGYMVCEKCGGFYKLQEGERPGDFDTCQCGGHLTYHQKVVFQEDMGNQLRKAYKSHNM
jgi:hypothetical protein